MKADRKRLKGEKTDLVSQMQQLYATLESREEQLRDFIRNYEQHRKVSAAPAAPRVGAGAASSPRGLVGGSRVRSQFWAPGGDQLAPGCRPLSPGQTVRTQTPAPTHVCARGPPTWPLRPSVSSSAEVP